MVAQEILITAAFSLLFPQDLNVSEPWVICLTWLNIDLGKSHQSGENEARAEMMMIHNSGIAVMVR